MPQPIADPVIAPIVLVVLLVMSFFSILFGIPVLFYVNLLLFFFLFSLGVAIVLHGLLLVRATLPVAPIYFVVQDASCGYIKFASAHYHDSVNPVQMFILHY
jgi:hypothetical protein